MTNPNGLIPDLTGTTLPNGWQVTEAVTSSDAATGGFASIGYIVHHPDGRKGFLKLLDFSIAFQQPDPAQALQFITTAFVFERDLLAKCGRRRLDHVVSALDHGTLPQNSGIPLQYLIFELAPLGDVRKYLDELSDSLDWAWLLRAAHNITVGLRQLHSLEIAHQDLKPSNVLIFNKQQSKVADLGRASSKDYASPCDGLPIAGDRTYAPPELLYSHLESDWHCRRVGCDLYHLGSMIYFFPMQIGITSALLSRLPADAQPDSWGGTYQEVKPYVEVAFGEVLAEFANTLPSDTGEHIVPLVRELCHPDPNQRGDPSRGTELRRRLDLERYVSRLDLLASRAESKLKASQ